MPTVLLQAHSLDHHARAALQPGASLTIHSIFDRALNLVDRHGMFFGLVGPRGGNGPGLVVLTCLPTGGFRSARLAIGDECTVGADGRLRLGTQLSLNLAEAELWQHPRIERQVEPETLHDNLEVAASLAFRQRGGDGLGGLLPHLERLLDGDEPPSGLPLLLRIAWAAVRDLLVRWPEISLEPALRLVGLGPGQTPAGDDLLAGLFVAALHRQPDDERIRTFADSLAQAASGRTTDLGLARLRYAAAGELDERSERALAALLGTDAYLLEVATGELLGYGHSSGLDTLVGLIIGCRAPNTRGLP